jgi:hypothetical protein
MIVVLGVNIVRRRRIIEDLMKMIYGPMNGAWNSMCTNVTNVQ